MYLIFIQLALLTYGVMFLLKSFSSEIFEQLLKARFLRYINKQYIQWVINTPTDEWISGDYNDKCYKERESESNDPQIEFEICINDSDSDSENEDKDLELLVGDPVTLLTNDRFGRIISMVINENSSSFSTSIKNMCLILCVKGLVGWGCMYELLVGIFLGMMIHMIDLLCNMCIYMQQWYFDSNKTFDIGKIINRNNKLSPKMTLVTPFGLVLLTAALRANVYTRILGEWIMDLRLSYLYVCMLIGYAIVQNYVNILCLCRKNPMMAILSIIYIFIAFLV